MFLKRLELLGAGQSGPERLISIATAAYAYAWAGRRARAVAHSDVATSYETFGEEVATSLRFIATSLHPPFLGLGRGWFVGNDGNGRSRIISSKHKGEHKACFHKGVGVVGGWCWRFVLACVRNREKSTGAGWVRGLSLLTELLGC